MSSDHITKILRESAYVYGFWASTKTGQKYFILDVDRTKKPIFLKSLESKIAINLPDFGTILYQDSVEPSKEEKALFHEKYGMYNLGDIR